MRLPLEPLGRRVVCSVVFHMITPKLPPCPVFDGQSGSVVKITCRPVCPFLLTDRSLDRRDRDAVRCEAVSDDDTNLELCELTVEVWWHETLTQEFRKMHLGFVAASVLVSARSLL
jgi:hypothetical protein